MWEALDDDCVSLIAWQLGRDCVASLCALRGVNRSTRAIAQETIMTHEGMDTVFFFKEGYGQSLAGSRVILRYTIRRLQTLYNPRVRSHSPSYVCSRCLQPTRKLLACKCHLHPPLPATPLPSPPPLPTPGGCALIDSYASASRMQYLTLSIFSMLPWFSQDRGRHRDLNCQSRRGHRSGGIRSGSTACFFINRTDRH